LSVALAPLGAAASDLIKIPIRKVPDDQHVAHLLSSHAPPRFAPSAATEATGRRLRGAPVLTADDIPLKDVQNAQYYGIVAVGTPPQNFEVVYDTGSADMWVPGTACASGSLNCASKRAFDRNSSSTFSDVEDGAKSLFQIAYGSGPVTGTYGVDTVTLAEDATVAAQTFALVDSTDGLGEMYGLSKFDGILGLAFPSISSDAGEPTVIADLASAGKGMFAFYLGDEADGELAIGGYNEDRMQGDINWVDLARPGYWLISMDGVKFGDEVIAASATGGIMDTGTSLIYGPLQQVDAMVATIPGAAFSAAIGLYSVPCDADIPDLEFVIGGKGYVVPGPDLVLRDDSGLYCFFGVAVMAYAGDSAAHAVADDLQRDVGDTATPTPGDGPVPLEFVANTWLVGDTFLRQHYTLYDYDNKKFGLAELKKGGQ